MYRTKSSKGPCGSQAAKRLKTLQRSITELGTETGESSPLLQKHSPMRSISESGPSTNKSSDCFAGLRFCVIPKNIPKARLDLLQNRAKSLGGDIIAYKPKTFLDACDYAIVDDSVPLDELVNSFKEFYNGNLLEKLDHVKFVKCTWLSNCLRTQQKQPEDSCLLNPTLKVLLTAAKAPEPQKDEMRNESPPKASKPSPRRLPTKVEITEEFDSFSDSDTDYHETTLETSASQEESFEIEVPCQDGNPDYDIDALAKRWAPKFACFYPSSSVVRNVNSHITSVLEKLKNANSAAGEEFKAMAYAKAINSVKNHPTKIENLEEVKRLKHVGERIGNKIIEILDSGTCKKVEHFCENNESLAAIDMFSKIHGVSQKIASKWVAAGIRTLEDLAKSSIELTTVQQIGVKYYHDFILRIPRNEVTEIERIVRQAALELQPGLEIVTCGSYRRGKPTCGDVDILITHPDGKSHRCVFKNLLDKLHATGFLTDDLQISDETSQKKYLGVCRLPVEAATYRRLDIIVVPYDEFGCALLYFTGSAHFNRSMRAYAHRLNMKLSHNGLWKNVMRKGKQKLNVGTKLVTPTERSVFEHLRLPYYEPQDRDH